VRERTEKQNTKRLWTPRRGKRRLKNGLQCKTFGRKWGATAGALRGETDVHPGGGGAGGGPASNCTLGVPFRALTMAWVRKILEIATPYHSRLAQQQQCPITGKFTNSSLRRSERENRSASAVDRRPWLGGALPYITWAFGWWGGAVRDKKIHPGQKKQNKSVTPATKWIG